MLHGVGPLRTQNPKKTQENSSFENCSHFRDIFPKKFKKAKSIFKVYSYIQKSTQNPINTFKITTYNTKHTKNAKIYLKNLKIKTIYQNSVIRILYMLYILYILYILYFYIYTRTRVGPFILSSSLFERPRRAKDSPKIALADQD